MSSLGRQGYGLVSTRHTLAPSAYRARANGFVRYLSAATSATTSPPLPPRTRVTTPVGGAGGTPQDEEHVALMLGWVGAKFNQVAKYVAVLRTAPCAAVAMPCPDGCCFFLAVCVRVVVVGLLCLDVLLWWLHIVRYEEPFYHSRGIPTVTVLAEPRHVIRPDEAIDLGAGVLQCVLRGLCDAPRLADGAHVGGLGAGRFLKDHPDLAHRRIIVHGFSVGAYFFAQLMGAMERDPQLFDKCDKGACRRADVVSGDSPRVCPGRVSWVRSGTHLSTSKA